MKNHIPTGASIGFTLVVAAATFAVAVVAGIFLIWQSGSTISAQSPGPAQTQSQISSVRPGLQRDAMPDSARPAPVITE